MSRRLTWRQRMARRLDPSLAEMPVRHVIDAPRPALAPPPEPTPTPEERAAQQVWPAICEQFALRILATAYQMGSHLETMEADEQDEERLEKLYRIDHANTRIRRQAENLQVLLGRRVDDASRQVTPLVDVVRAATSAIEHYPRIHIGQMVDLAVTEFAADDVIRVLTELLDNATRFSPPTSSVIVSAYPTETGSLLIRVEDAGLGVQPEQLPVLNAMLAGTAPPALDGNPASHLGLIVVSRLALANQLRVHLTNRQSGGTTANVVIPDGLLCEVVPNRSGAGPVPPADPARAARSSQRRPDPAATYLGSAQVPGSRLTLVNGQSADGGRPARREPATGNNGLPGRSGTPGVNGLPRRVRESLRGDGAPVNGGAPAQPAAVPSAAPQPRTSPESASDRAAWPDEAADFAAGFSDFASGANDTPWPATNENSEGNPR